MVSNQSSGAWGGPWTTKKLNAFEDYVKAYLKIMSSNKHWKLVYFDGFAGSGIRRNKTNTSLFAGLDISEEETNVYKGSAERLVSMEAPNVFDYYYFIEKNEKSKELLKKRLSGLPASFSKTLVFRQGDCNDEILKLGNALRAGQLAALVFLDPFGMQINWESIASLQNTRSDIWILIPTAVIVNRLLDNEGKLNNLKKLTSFFGMPESAIREKFYPKTDYTDLFGNTITKNEKVLDPINKIAEVYCSNLRLLWKHVSKPLRLNNRNGAPLFHFVFASNNATALKIAEYIIQNP
jgi:three-Cys-motif partner protein